MTLFNIQFVSVFCQFVNLFYIFQIFHAVSDHI